MKKIFGHKVKPVKDLFPHILSTDDDYCVLGVSDNYICLIEWENRGNYGEFLRVKFEDLEKDFIFFDDSSNDTTGNDLFGKKIVFKECNHVLKNIELCVIGICENAIAVIDWKERGEYHFECYSLNNMKDFEVIEN